MSQVANPIYPSYLSFLSVARELTIGTAIVGTSTIPLDPGSYEPEDTPHFLPDEAIRGAMVHLYNEIQGVEDATFTYGGPVYLDNDGFFFDNVFGDLSTTGTVIGGGTVSSLSQASVIGTTSGTIASNTGFQVGASVQIDVGSLAEVVVVSATAATTISFANNPLRFPHNTGATLKTVSGPYCVDENTEILTDHGWSTVHDLSTDDIVLTYNHTTGMSEWQPVDEVCIFPAEPREMISMKGVGHSSLTTPNHRWPVVNYYGNRFWKTTETLKTGNRIPIAAYCADLPKEPKYTDDFVSLVAWFWTEGHIRETGSIRIKQSWRVNQGNVDLIDASLRGVFGAPQDNINVKNPAWSRDVDGTCVRFAINKAGASHLLEIAPDRVVSTEFINQLTQAQLDLFIKISMLGDNSGPTRLHQHKQAQAEAFQYAATIAGYGTSLLERVDSRFDAPYSMWGVTLQKRRWVTPMNNVKVGSKCENGFKIERILHEGIVWCPRTKNATWFARRDGQCYFTGNTHIFNALNSGTGQPPTHTLTDYQGITASTGARAYVSSCVATLDLTGNAEQLLSWKVSGSSWISAVAATKPTAQSNYVVPIPNWRGNVTVGGGTIYNIGEWSVSLKRPLKIYWTAQNSQNPFFIARGPLDCVGTLNYTVATDETALTNMLNNTQPALNISMNNGSVSTSTSFLSFTFNAAQAAYVKSKPMRNSELIGFQTEFQTVANAINTGGSGGLGPATVTIVNNTPTY